MPFPLIKLAYLAVRQLSKPLANYLKDRAKTHPRFRKLCMGVAQTYHRGETNMRLKLLGFTKSNEVTPLSEEMAVDLGAQMLGESVIYVIGSLVIVAEYARQRLKDQGAQEKLNQRFEAIEAKHSELNLRITEKDFEIADLKRELLALQTAPFHKRS